LADADIDAPEGRDAGGLGSFPVTGGVKVGIVDKGPAGRDPSFGFGRVNLQKALTG